MTENKPIIRGITINDTTLSKKIEVLVGVKFGPLAESEMLVLKSLIEYANEKGSLYLDSLLAEGIRKNSNINKSSFSTSLHRLDKKGIIARAGKTINIHPVFIGVATTDKFLITFKQQ